MSGDNYLGNSDLRSVICVPSTFNGDEDLWEMVLDTDGYVRIVNKYHNKYLHLTGDIYNGSINMKSICGVPITWNGAEDLWKIE